MNNQRNLIIFFLILVFISFAFADFQRDIELGRRYIALDKYQEARDLLEPYLVDNSTNETLLRLLKEVYKYLKDSEALMRIIQAELVQYPDRADLWVELGEVYITSGNIDEAEKAFDKSLKLDSWSETTVLDVYKIYHSWGYAKQAIDLLLSARKKMDDQLAFAMDLATLYEIKGDWQSAADEYGNYLTKYPDRFTNVERRMNEIAADEEQLEDVEKAVERLRDAGVQGDRVDRLLSRLQYRQGKYQEGLESLIRAEQIRGRKGAYVLTYMIEIFRADAHLVVLEAGDYLEDAETHISEQAGLYKGLSLKELDRVEDSERLFKQLSKSRTADIACQAITQLGYIELNDKSDLDQAKGYFSEVVDKYSRNHHADDAFHGLVDIYFMEDDLRAVGQTLQRRRSIAPEDPWAIYGLGELAFYRGSVDTAGAIFRQVALSFPKSPEANDAVELLAIIVDIADSELKNRITNLFLLIRKKLEEEVLDEISEIIDESGEAKWLDILLWKRGLIYLDLGKEELAKTDFNRIVENYSDGFHASVALEKMGDIRVNSGNLAGGLELYNQVLADHSEAVNVERVRAKIKQINKQI